MAKQGDLLALNVNLRTRAYGTLLVWLWTTLYERRPRRLERMLPKMFTLFLSLVLSFGLGSLPGPDSGLQHGPATHHSEMHPAARCTWGKGNCQ